MLDIQINDRIVVVDNSGVIDIDYITSISNVIHGHKYTLTKNGTFIIIAYRGNNEMWLDSPNYLKEIWRKSDSNNNYQCIWRRPFDIYHSYHTKNTI